MDTAVQSSYNIVWDSTLIPAPLTVRTSGISVNAADYAICFSRQYCPVWQWYILWLYGIVIFSFADNFPQKNTVGRHVQTHKISLKSLLPGSTMVCSLFYGGLLFSFADNFAQKNTVNVMSLKKIPLSPPTTVHTFLYGDVLCPLAKTFSLEEPSDEEDGDSTDEEVGEDNFEDNLDYLEDEAELNAC